MKKRYLIMLIIAIILIICLGVSLAFAYFFTDIFKSNKQLFSKYISQNSEILEIFKDKDIIAYSDKQKNTPFTSEGTIKTNVTFPDSSEAKVANALQNCNITFTGKTDNSNKYTHQTIKANYSDTQSLQFDLYENGDIYAGKINEVLFKYIGIENNNLKEFATKMQLPEEITSEIPNKIDLNELEKTSNVFSDEELSSLKEKYLKIVVDNLTDDMFSKESTSDDTIYILTINEEQIKNIYIKILESLKEDETIINKYKEVLISNYNITEDKVQTYITQYKDIIQNAIDNSFSSSDAKILDLASKAQERSEQAQIKERIQLAYNETLMENSGNVDKQKLQATLEEYFGFGKVTDLADDFSTVKIDEKEYSIIENSTNNTDSTTENIADNNNENNNLEDDTNSSNNITIKVYSNKSELTKTEIDISNLGSFVVLKSDDGVKFEIMKDSSTLASAYAQKLKSPNETRFEFSISNADSEICNLTTSFSGLDTNSVNESSELSFDIGLGNSMITNAKTKFVSTYKNTKTFGDIQRENIQNSEILLLNTAPTRSNIEQLYKNIETRFTQINNAKLQALGLTDSQNPFMYYIPSVIPIGATYIMQNPDKSPYFVTPAVIGGISVSMLIGDNSILTQTTNNNASNEILTIKEEIIIEVSNAVTDYYSKKYSTNANSTESLYASVENVLKNYKPNTKNIEYSYDNHIITIRSKTDPTKIITGTLSETGSINWN